MPSKTLESLTEDQQSAFDTITGAIQRDSAKQPVICLKGYAGTGKTFLTSRLIRWLRQQAITVLAAAPTHKAARELERQLGAKANSVVTIASLLRKKRQRDGKGGWTYRSGVSVEVLRGEYGSVAGGVLLVDEASMLTQADFDALLEVFAGCRAILLIGDPAQLPPVDEVPAAVFQEDDVEVEGREVVRCTLTDVVRYDGNVLKLATRIRKYRAGLPPMGLDVGGNLELVESAHHWERRWLELVKGGHEPGVRALAFTNSRVNQLNALALQQDYGDQWQEYHPGQLLVTVEGVEVVVDSKKVMAYPSTTEITVCKAHKSEERLFDGGVRVPSGVDELEQVNTWVLTVKDKLGNRHNLNVLDKNSEELFASVLKALRKDAINADVCDRSEKWRAYYVLAERYHQVQPAYALTIHKSQGSTFDTVFLDVENIVKKGGMDRRVQNRLAYVGATRAKDSLVMFL